MFCIYFSSKSFDRGLLPSRPRFSDITSTSKHPLILLDHDDDEVSRSFCFVVILLLLPATYRGAPGKLQNLDLIHHYPSS